LLGAAWVRAFGVNWLGLQISSLNLHLAVLVIFWHPRQDATASSKKFSIPRGTQPHLQVSPAIFAWTKGKQIRSGENDNRLRSKGDNMKFKKRYTRFVALLAVGIIAAIGTAHAGSSSGTFLTQVAELEKQIHVTFHAAVSVHDPINGDSPAVITQRIRDVLSIFTQDAQLTLVSTTSPAAGNYIGNGDPDDPTTCPLPSGDTSATGQQGTLCTLFKYVAGGLQITNKWVSLTPAYKTKFDPVNIGGQWQSSFYFECHYFDVSLDPATGQPSWTAKSHVDLDGEAKKINGRWLLTHVSSSAVGIPVP
jgi:hypothetical protein